MTAYGNGTRQLSWFCGLRVFQIQPNQNFIPTDMRNHTSIFALSLAFSGWLAQETSINLSDYLGDMTARQIGQPDGGRVIDLEAHPTNPRIYVAVPVEVGNPGWRHLIQSHF